MASERFLLVQLADIGDLALTTPAIAALRDARPDATLDLFASTHALPLIPDDLVDNQIPFQRDGRSASRAFFAPSNLRQLLRIARGKYAALVFFHHFTLRAGLWKFRLIAKASGAPKIIGLQNDKVGFLTASIPDQGFGARHQAQYWLDLVGLLGADSRPRPALVKRVPNCEALSQTSPSADVPRVVIHAGSGGYSRARRWSRDGFAAVARGLKTELDAEIILVGQADDDSAAVKQLLDFETRDVSGRTTLPQLADLIARADLFIGADSGVMHIAAATGTPVLSIFGPSNADAWRPWAAKGRAAVLRSGVACSPCSYVGSDLGALAGCPARTCMKLVRPEHVLEAARALLADKPEYSDTLYSPAAETKDRSEPARPEVLGVPVDAVSYDSWIEHIDAWISAGGGARQVCTVNPEFIMIAQRDPIFFHTLKRAALCVPDGVGLLWASRQLGSPLPERVTGSDGVPLIAQHAAERGWRIFLLGAAPGIAERAAEILQDANPGLQFAGTYAGSPAEAEEDEIVALINRSRADILFVAYGAPKQDKWIARNLPRLEVAMAMGVGGSLDFIAGAAPRAPRWLQARGLEWLYRLIRQPWRLRRMLRLPRFVLAVLWRARG